MRGIAPLIAYYETKPTRRLRWREHYLFWNPTWNYDGDLTFNGVGHITVFETPNFWTTFFRVDWRPPRIDDRLTRGGPLGLTPTVHQALMEVSTDSRKKHRVSAFAYYWTRKDGAWTASASIGPTIRPSSAVRLQFSPEYSRNYSTSQYVTRQADPAVTDTYGARYVFATLDQHQFGMTTRLDWTFTPEISLQLFAQPLLSVGDFKDYKEFATPRQLEFEVYGRDIGTISRDQAGVYTVDPDGAGPSSAFTFSDRDFNSRFLRGNAVLRWEYRPGSALFLVWQQSRSGFAPTGVFDFGRDFGELWGTPPVNVFVVKATYWIGR
jgi:hypothetical protein